MSELGYKIGECMPEGVEIAKAKENLDVCIRCRFSQILLSTVKMKIAKNQRLRYVKQSSNFENIPRTTPKISTE